MENIDHLKAKVAELEKKVEELALEKQHVISIVSHDLRSPLNRLFALIQLMQMDIHTLSDQQKDYLEKMYLVIADGLSMMRNLVDYRNLEYREIETRIEPLNITELVRTMVKNSNAIAEKKKIELFENCESGLIIHTDKQCAHRVLDNILSNAIKFSAAGKKVWVRLSSVTSQQVKIEIEDEARGFLSGDYEKLFQKFQKLSARPTAGESSTGLGLFVAKSMADKISGEISCRTIAGLGSVFTVILPSIK
jgi:two-component system sensor histidine kinase/response regulator